MPDLLVLSLLVLSLLVLSLLVLSLLVLSLLVLSLLVLILSSDWPLWRLSELQLNRNKYYFLVEAGTGISIVRDKIPCIKIAL